MIQFRLVGSDSEYFYILTPSETVKHKEYEIRISKRNGTIYCACKDALCRAKTPSIVKLLAGLPSTCCKHVDSLVKIIKETNE